MASIIRVKRSTGTTAPGSLQFGELGLTIGTGTQANKGERLFVGDNSGNVDVVGGRYFTDLMVHAPGTVTSVTNPTTAANGFVAIIRELPYSISESGTIKFSPSTNSVDEKSLPDLEYFT